MNDNTWRLLTTTQVQMKMYPRTRGPVVVVVVVVILVGIPTSGVYSQ
jgi:hypothetical protein